MHWASHMLVPNTDNAAAITASGVTNSASTGKLPSGYFDCLLTISFAGIAGASVTALQLQGSNDNATWNNVAIDKGVFVAVAAAGRQTFHFAQTQYLYYRVQLTSGALTGTPTFTTVWNFHALQYSEQATVQ